MPSSYYLFKLETIGTILMGFRQFMLDILYDALAHYVVLEVPDRGFFGHSNAPAKASNGALVRSWSSRIYEVISFQFFVTK